MKERGSLRAESRAPPLGGVADSKQKQGVCSARESAAERGGGGGAGRAQRPAEEQDEARTVRPGGGREVGCGCRGSAEQAVPDLGGGSGRPRRAGPRRRGRHDEGFGGRALGRWRRGSAFRIVELLPGTRTEIPTSRKRADLDGGYPRE